MKREEKIEWMAVWCAKNGAQLVLEGSCGFGRDCVGILKNNIYPDYDVEDAWVPENAYHKHDCVAVLGHGEEAEAELYDWLKWFDANGYTVEATLQEVDPALGALAYVLGKHHNVRMVKKTDAQD